MPVPVLITDLSQTAASNFPAGSNAPSTLDDTQRAHGAFIAQLRDGKGFTSSSTVASAATTDIGAQNSMFVDVTGTVTITSFGTTYNGPRFLRFAAALTLTHNSTSLILPGGANITTAAGDTLVAIPKTTGVTADGWVVVAYQKNSGANVSSTDLQAQTYTAFTTAGTSTAYTLTPTPAITAYVAGQSFWVTLHTASGAAPTLQISGVATPPNLVQRKGDGTYENVNNMPAGAYRITLVSATQALMECPAVVPANGVATASIGDLAVTPAKLSQKPTLGTPVSLSGTASQFTGIPTWAKRVVVSISGMSTNGTSRPVLRVGPSSGVVSAGYLGSTSQMGTAVSSALVTAGFGVAESIGGTSPYHGSFTLTLISAASNLWTCTGVFARSDVASTQLSAGSITLAGALERVSLTTENGTDTFDAGTINILYEG